MGCSWLNVHPLVYEVIRFFRVHIGLILFVGDA